MLQLARRHPRWVGGVLVVLFYALFLHFRIAGLRSSIGVTATSLLSSSHFKQENAEAAERLQQQWEVEREQFRLTDKKLERFVDTFMAKLDDHLNKLDKQYQKVELLDHHMQSSFKEVVQALQDEMVDMKSLERASPAAATSQHRQPPPPSQPLPTTIEEVEVENEEDEEEDEEDEEETEPKEDVAKADTPPAQVAAETDSTLNGFEGIVFPFHIKPYSRTFPTGNYK